MISISKIVIELKPILEYTLYTFSDRYKNTEKQDTNIKHN